MSNTYDRDVTRTDYKVSTQGPLTKVEPSTLQPVVDAAKQSPSSARRKRGVEKES